MKNISWLMVVSLLLLFISCVKNIEEPLPVSYYGYCGDWGSVTRSIKINEDGTGSVEEGGMVEDGKVFFEGWTIRFHEVMKFGNTKFHIDVPPYIDSLTGRTIMKLDGENFYKN